MAPKMKFAEGEKVLCFHGPLIYEAKCLKSSVTKDKHVKYFIHYAGWNKNWDEWVPESRVLKYNDANVQKQKEVQQAHSAQPTKTKKASKSRKSEAAADDTRSTTPAAKETELTPAKGGRNVNKESHNDSGSEQAKKKLRGRLDLTTENEELHATIKITLPNELKQLLTDDWYAVTKQQKLLSLPAKNTINKIFESYIQQKNLTSLENKTVIDGIKDHFNAIINRQLLYDFEKLHHKTTVSGNPGLSLCDIYGLVHLLRLFTKFGGMLSYLDMEDKALQYTLNMIKEFFDYLVKNRSTLVSVDDYISSTPEYQKKAFN